MALSSFYLAFTRILQLVRLNGRGKSDLAFEVIMLRHEVHFAVSSSDRQCDRRIVACSPD